ncbi:MAG: imidazoleglycerol-phosphate dehydratase, partial [Acutalibacteraceae bacterium]
DLNVRCDGDTYVDDHHSVEDIGIALGEAFAKAIGDKRGITRYGSIILAMDESLLICALDVSGRSYLGYNVFIPSKRIGNFDSELIEEFFLGFVRKSEITLHFKQLEGKNSHHIAEAMFKSFGRALSRAVKINAETMDEIPSTKGVL